MARRRAAPAGRANDAVVATKFGQTYDEDSRQITGKNTSPEYMGLSSWDAPGTGVPLVMISAELVDQRMVHDGLV